jgi:NAD(P)-dependent dehydrogenase (short-subunit alcohol dehydrogenase family)
MRSVVVTGASTGIGHATAAVLIGAGFRVFGSVRKEADAERLTRELGHYFTPLLFDVTDEAAVAAAAGEVRAAVAGTTLAGLVNNAGIAVPGPLLELPVDAFRHQIEVNLTGQFIVTRAFAPLLGADPSLDGPRGRIVMIGSASGRRGFPFIGAYAASKHALEGLSESLRREMMLYGIDVILIAPGMVDTPIWDKADAGSLAASAGGPYAAPLRNVRAYMSGPDRGHRAEAVAAVVLTALTRSRPKARYALPSSPVGDLAMRLLPARLLDRIIARRLGLRRKDGGAR